MPDYHAQKAYWEGLTDRRPPEHPSVRAFCAPKINIVRREVGDHGQTMLEVGAGNGFFTYELMRYFVLTALDFSDNMLRMNPAPARRKIRGDAQFLPFDDDSFDIVLCGNLLHHLPDPIVAVREMARVARRHVALIEPNALNPAMLGFGLLKREERGSIRFTPRYLRTLGGESGLRLRRFVTQGTILPNRTPCMLLPLLRPLDFPQPFAFYNVAVFDAATGSVGDG
ncbi:MAG: class I SAM-dependent methyltransferase [Gemmatimonadota bacterium]